jgi:uncharacterized membrane protein YeaQ/YmgE (transglycosylase-associated protein family)
MNLTIGELIVWLIVGALAGSLAGRVVTLKKEGLGRWTNLGVGLGGAVIGGGLFNILNVDLGLGELTVSFEDLLSAFVGSLMLLIGWWGIGKVRKKKIS